MKARILLSGFVFLFIFSVRAFPQKSIRDSAISTSLISISYGFQYPANDLANKFYANSSIGGFYLYKTASNWLFGAGGFFMFRDKIKETGILDSIATSDGNIIDGNGIYTEVRLWERGFNISGHMGKILPIVGPNKNSGIVLLGGIGLLQHKIRIENPGNTTPQIKGDYKKGYDRLTNGISFSEFIGYMHLGNNKLVSFYAGFEFVQAFTRNRRSYNFDLMGPDLTKRMDVLYGIRVGWIIPLYRRAPEKYYFY